MPCNQVNQQTIFTADTENFQLVPGSYNYILKREPTILCF